MDTSALEAVVDSIIAENPGDWAEYVSGTTRSARSWPDPSWQGHEGHAGQGDGRAATALLEQRRAGS